MHEQKCSHVEDDFPTTKAPPLRRGVSTLYRAMHPSLQRGRPSCLSPLRPPCPASFHWPTDGLSSKTLLVEHCESLIYVVSVRFSDLNKPRKCLSINHSTPPLCVQFVLKTNARSCHIVNGKAVLDIGIRDRFASCNI